MGVQLLASPPISSLKGLHPSYKCSRLFNVYIGFRLVRTCKHSTFHNGSARYCSTVPFTWMGQHLAPLVQKAQCLKIWQSLKLISTLRKPSISWSSGVPKYRPLILKGCVKPLIKIVIFLLLWTRPTYVYATCRYITDMKMWLTRLSWHAESTGGNV